VSATWFEGFEARDFDLDGARVHARIGGREGAPPLLLLHGFPQTHAMWHRVAQILAPRFRLVLPDLRGYGDSARPPGAAEHANYSKRVMAQDLANLMRELGQALDHAQRVTKLAVIDIAPTLDMYEATDVRFASLYYHWFFLIQPAPHPERMIGADSTAYLHWKLGRWGAGAASNYREPEALAEFERCFSDPANIHGACEDYRASFGIDLQHDRDSRAAGQKVACDMLVLWGQRGVVNQLFDPPALWRAQCAGRVTGEVMGAGHYIPEELPEQTAAHLGEFFAPVS
jgi:haloacetate dehalogenase